jgi:hypothetical protein
VPPGAPVWNGGVGLKEQTVLLLLLIPSGLQRQERGFGLHSWNSCTNEEAEPRGQLFCSIARTSPTVWKPLIKSASFLDTFFFVLFCLFFSGLIFGYERRFHRGWGSY